MSPDTHDLLPRLYERARQIRLLVLDVDGVLTDGSIIYTGTGEEIKVFHVRDGHGLRLIQQAGLEIALITGRQSPAVAHRARNLQITHVFQGIRDKLEVLRALQAELGISHAETAVMGDDLVDLPILMPAGLSVAVADAPQEVKARVYLVTAAPGGRGAVREVCELLLQAQGKWKELLRQLVGA